MPKGRYKKIERSLKKDRERDYEITKDVNAALFGNLMRSTKRGGKRLTAANERSVSKMLRMQDDLAARGQRKEGRFTRARAGHGDSGMLANAMGKMSNDIRISAKAENVAAAGQVRAGKTIARSGEGAVGMIKAGAREAKSNADALTADVLSQRAQADANTIATMQHEEAMMRLQARLAAQQAQLEFERQKKLMALEEKKAMAMLDSETEAGEASNFRIFKAPIKRFANMVPEIIQYRKDNPEATNEEIRTYLTEKFNMSPTDAASPVVGQLLFSLSQNDQAGPDSIVEEFIDAMQTSEQWASLTPKQHKQLKVYIRTSLETVQARYASGAIQSESGDNTNGLAGLADAWRDRATGPWMP